MVKYSRALAFLSQKAMFVPDIKSALFGTAVVLVSTLVGMALGLGIYPVVIVLLTMVAGLALVAYPMVGLWVVIYGALIGAGLVDLYMPMLKPLIWGLTILSFGIAAIGLAKALLGGNRQSESSVATGHRVAIWALIFLMSAIFSSVTNWHGMSGLLVGLKGYFQIWCLLIAIYFLIRNELDARRLIMFFLFLGVLQLPFVMHQFLVLVPKRSGELFAAHGIVAGDIVAGTFGGSMMGGGRSSNLALLSVFCVTLVLAQWRAGWYKTGRTLLACVFFLIPMFLSEAKLFLILLPIALFILFLDRILHNPLKALVGAIATVMLMVSIFFAYSLLPGAKSQSTKSLTEMLDQNIEYNVGQRGYGNLLLNRTTVYSFWVKEHAHGSMLIRAITGHGPGTSSEGTVLNNDTLAYKRYRGYGIGLTGLSSLLWEVGLMGTGALFAMLLAAYIHATRLADRWRGTSHWPMLKASQISIPLFAVSLLHNNYFVFDLSYQAMLMMVLGYLLAMGRFEKKSV